VGSSSQAPGPCARVGTPVDGGGWPGPSPACLWGEDAARHVYGRTQTTPPAILRAQGMLGLLFAPGVRWIQSPPACCWQAPGSQATAAKSALMPAAWLARGRWLFASWARLELCRRRSPAGRARLYTARRRDGPAPLNSCTGFRPESGHLIVQATCRVGLKKSPLTTRYLVRPDFAPARLHFGLHSSPDGPYIPGTGMLFRRR
jgi:hypothetical protein